MVRKIGFIVILQLSMLAVSAQEAPVKPTEEMKMCFQYLDASPADSIEFAIGLSKVADYCLKEGEINEAFVVASTARNILCNELKFRIYPKTNALTSKKKPSIREKETLQSLNKQINRISGYVADFGVILGTYCDCYNFSNNEDLTDFLYNDAIKCYDELGPTSVLKHIRTLILLGNYHKKKKNYLKAEKALTNALDLNQHFKVLPKEEEYSLWNNLAGAFINYGNTINAEKAIQALDNISLPPAIDAVRLTQRANLAIYKRDYTKAFQYCELALQRYRLSRPTLSDLRKMLYPPNFISELSFTANLFSISAEKAKVLELYKLIQEELFHTLEHNLTLLIYDTERRAIWTVLQPFFDNVQKYTYSNQNLTGAKELLYENLQLQKDLFLNSLFQYPSVAKLMRTDKQVQNRLLQIEAMTNDENMTNTIVGTNQLGRVKYGIETFHISRDLISYINQHCEGIAIQRGTWNKVNLQPGSAVVEFFELVPTGKTEKEYGALIFSKLSKSPQIVTLCTENVLKKEINNETKWSSALYNLLWKPIVPHLGTSTDIYISTTGLLNTLSFSGLRSGNTYLCEKYNLHYTLATSHISQGKQIAEPSQKKNIYLFGGVDFGLPVPASSDTRGQGFGYLPGSLKEVESISKLLSPRWTVHKFIGKDATEKNLRALAKRTDISVLHISTHGFYLPYDPSIREKAININGKSGFFEPTIRTGIAFTGSNIAWRNGSTVDLANDCLLTAMEIITLCHLDAELVVLSACNTGIGEIKDGEGVYSLQRAFRSIGVKSMIVSLGDVPDKETEELMKKFYELWQTGLSKHAAFTKAQRYMKSRYPDEPEKWAGFIFIE